MSDLCALARHPSAGRLEAVRHGVRFSHSDEADPQRHTVEFGADREDLEFLDAGPFRIEWDRVFQGTAALIEGRVRNTSDAEVVLESVIFGFRWRTSIPGSLRFLQNGWQSWSYTGSRNLDSSGEAPFPSGPWLRGMHHALGEVPEDRVGWHQSATVSVAGPGGGGSACLVGALETGRAFSLVYLRRCEEWIEVELEQLVEVPLAGGETIELETVRVALGDDASRLLEGFAELWGRAAGARTQAPFQSGWCSWYHFFHDVTESDLLRNLDALAQRREELPVDIVQLDDGYQRAIGDWRDTNEKFSSTLPQLAERIREAGFTPGLWTAPFCVVGESRLFEQQSDWLLRSEPDDEDPFYRGTLHPVWAATGRVYALDPTRPEVLEHLRGLFSDLVEMGFHYLKLDFLHTVSGRARAADPRVSRAARLHRGLRAIREGAGDDAFLLGCGCPFGPAVGIVDGMRIGPDVAPSWLPPSPGIPGIETALPSTRSAVRSILSRAWMHRRLWINDPDCLMARSTDTELTEAERTTLADAIAGTGGMVVVSDDVPHLAESDLLRVRETLEIARDVDALAPRGQARSLDILEGEIPATLLARQGAAGWLGRFNGSDAVRRVSDPSDFGRGGQGVLSSQDDTRAKSSLQPHASELVRLTGMRDWVIFCDFDGTFSVQDVGSTIAALHVGDRRPEVHARFRRGEITAWESNTELLDGLALAEPELKKFLHTIDLDPGAADLLEWCRSKKIPFEILSDGFDYNLDRLQEIHGLEFRYAANHLRIREGRWRIEAGHPNPECTCGTGTCKWGRIQTFRSENPGVGCIHIGNGQVSDLCGALAADVTFAKDTLAPALAARGEAYEEFETLRDVIATLERWGL